MTKRIGYPFLIVLVAFFSFFINLGSLEPDIMEARNFITVREILENNDWLHPTLNGELRLAKPPLPTWITASFASVFGLEDIFFLRLPAALMSLWLLFSMYGIVVYFQQNKKIALLTSLVLGTMLYVMLIGRRGTWDIYTHGFMLAAILQFLYAVSGKFSLLNGVLGGLFLGASILSKGPVAAYTVLLPFLLSFTVFYQKIGIKKKILPLLIFLFIGFIVAFLWYYYAYLEFGKQGVFILEKEVNNWTQYNTKPWYYYIKDYPVHAGVWALTLAVAMFSSYVYNKSVDKKRYLFFWLWTFLSLVLLSFVPEKKVRYLLPTFIPASFLVANYLEYLISRFKENANKIDGIIYKIHWWIFFVATVSLPVVVYFLFFSKGLLPLVIFCCICFCSLFVGVIFIGVCRKKNYLWFVVGIFSLIAVLTTFIVPYTQKVANPNFRNIAEVQNISSVLQLDCYALETTRIDLVWHIGKKIKEVKNLENLAPPYILLTDNPPCNYLSKEVYYHYLGRYDNNSKAMGHRLHRNSLSKYVTIVLP